MFMREMIRILYLLWGPNERGRSREREKVKKKTIPEWMTLRVMIRLRCCEFETTVQIVV